MSETERCPMCAAGPLEKKHGQLDQSGATHLHTMVHACAICGYARYEPALHAGWRADDAACPGPRSLRDAA